MPMLCSRSKDLKVIDIFFTHKIVNLFLMRKIVGSSWHEGGRQGVDE